MREKAELVAQLQITQESFDTKLAYYEKQISLLTEEKIMEIEKYMRENEILKSEKELLSLNMEDLKKVIINKIIELLYSFVLFRFILPKKRD